MGVSKRLAILYSDVLLLHANNPSADDKSVLQDSHGIQSTFPSLKPSISPSVELSLTIVYISLYTLLFLIVYVQLWMIWYYRHKRLSYQTVFLFLCLLFSGLRVSLFSFYFNNCDLANDLPWPVYWILYGFPVCLQFTTLCLLVLFFAQVIFKARAKYEPSKFKRPLRILVIVAIIVFLISNIVCAMIVKRHEKDFNSIPMELLYVRIAINDTLFVIFGILLSFCIYKMSKLTSSSLVLEAKGTTMCQAITACVVILLLFTSRAVYNFISIYPSVKSHMPGFGYDWVNVSDQADITNLQGGYAYISFGIVLFVWEVLPTFVVVLFFRVKRAINSVSLTDLSSHSHSSKVFFFDNPRRYDSEDDLSQSVSHSASPYDISSANSVNYGSARSTPQGTPRRISSQAGLARMVPRITYGSFVSSSLPAGRVASSPQRSGPAGGAI